MAINLDIGLTSKWNLIKFQDQMKVKDWMFCLSWVLCNKRKQVNLKQCLWSLILPRISGTAEAVGSLPWKSKSVILQSINYLRTGKSHWLQPWLESQLHCWEYFLLVTKKIPETPIFCRYNNITYCKIQSNERKWMANYNKI